MKNTLPTWMKTRFIWIRDNIQLIVLIPVVLGGLWQLFELASISVSFIRFFSVSQLIADGLLVLLILCPVAGIFLYIELVYGRKDANEKNEAIVPSKAIGVSLLWISFAIATFVWLCLPYWKGIFVSKKQEIIPFLIALFITLISINIFYSNLRKLTKYIGRIFKSKDSVRESLNGSRVIISSVLFLALVIGVVVSIFKLRNNYLIPENLRNFRQIECVVKKEVNLSDEKWRVVYFNDQYIFVEITNGDLTQHLVVSFDALFDQKRCN